jgi:hypothetical protein
MPRLDWDIQNGPLGRAGGVTSWVVGAILIIFLVLLITDLLGLTDVFPFVKKSR